VLKDDAPLGQRLRQQLQAKSYDVSLVHDGKMAGQAIEGGEPDLVILDLNLPQLDGLFALQQMRVSQPRLPVLTLTECLPRWTAWCLSQHGSCLFAGTASTTAPFSMDPNSPLGIQYHGNGNSVANGANYFMPVNVPGRQMFQSSGNDLLGPLQQLVTALRGATQPRPAPPPTSCGRRSTT